MDVTHFDDPESVDAHDDLDLSPRAAAAPAATGGSAKKWGMWGLFGVIIAAVVALGISLANASTYYYNVDEALERRQELGDKRIRLQGNVIEGSVEEGTRLRFVLSYGGKDVVVQHTGEVPDLFGPSIPMIIEGKFVGDEFHSDRVFARHDETYEEDSSYEEEHPDRIKDAEADAERNAGRTASAAAGD